MDAFCILFLPNSQARNYLHTVMNNLGKSRHLSFVPNLRGKVFSLLPLSMMLAVYFSVDTLYQALKFLYMSGLLRVLIKNAFGISQMHFLPLSLSLSVSLSLSLSFSLSLTPSSFPLLAKGLSIALILSKNQLQLLLLSLVFLCYLLHLFLVSSTFFSFTYIMFHLLFFFQ